MMKWEHAELVEISIGETAYGGTPDKSFDQQWFDEKGALVVNFKS